MLTYKTTHLVALNKKTGEEVARHLVEGHGLFTVAPRTCDVETCGNSEGAETPVRYNVDHPCGYWGHLNQPSVELLTCRDFFNMFSMYSSLTTSGCYEVRVFCRVGE